MNSVISKKAKRAKLEKLMENEKKQFFKFHNFFPN